MQYTPKAKFPRILKIIIVLLFFSLAASTIASTQNPTSPQILFPDTGFPPQGQSEPADNLGIVESGSPVMYIQIPKININAPVIAVGLASDGSMGVPKGPATAAWYDLGPRPGEIGNAVIDGHSGWKNGIPAIFDNLKILQAGDMIYLKDLSGTVNTFVVQTVGIYGRNQNATNVFISNDGKAHLNLISCTGTWDPILKTHLNRIVVFTDKVN